MKNFQYHKISKDTQQHRIVVTAGKQKGLVALTTNMWYGGKVSLALDPVLHIPYENCELADDAGKPIIVPVTDQTGREIEVGSWIVFSVIDRKRHGLEMGRVETISPKGTLRVERMLKNGEKVAFASNSWGRKYTTVTDANRTVLLPVTNTDLTTWVLKGFEDLYDAL